MTERLPLKFKLFLNGKFVGYETHRLYTEKNRAFTGLIDIIQSEDGYDWFSVYFEKGCIPHDHKRQLTGLQDMHGKDIAFGDKLKYIELGLIYEVVWDFHKIIGYHGEKNKMTAIYFDQLELVED